MCGAMRVSHRAVTAALVLHVIAAVSACPPATNCICGGSPAVELKCNIDDRSVNISLLPHAYIHIQCGHAPDVNYDKLPNLSANRIANIKSVTFKDCPLPETSFRDVLTKIGVKRTISLIFQNSRNLTRHLERKHFTGLKDLSKLLLSVTSATYLPDNLFMDMRNLTWLNIRSNGNNLSGKLFEPLAKLSTLEINHNGMNYLPPEILSHLKFLRKLSLWQSSATRFSEDLLNKVEVLEELDLSSNSLNDLPPSIFNPLTKLKKLTLFSNKFSSLPPKLFERNKALDTVIILNNNTPLKTLPKGLFEGKPNLTEVYIQRCSLEEVPPNVFTKSPNLTNISMAYNEIEFLPEAIFNDQINLLDLDLSYNKIKKLEPKLFSSLVRLEVLKLSHNSLKAISGSTFSPLLSLTYLDIEHNNLKTISGDLFSYNKQKMTINLAYNRLSFEKNILVNDTWKIDHVSPFARTYNLNLLNLSHNEFTMTFVDWWSNGHEKLDFSFNKISELPDSNLSQRLLIKYSKPNLMSRPLEQVWMDHNPVNVTCDTLRFLHDLMKLNTKGVSWDQFESSTWTLMFCSDSMIVAICVAPIAFGLFILALHIIFRYKREIIESIKQYLSRTPFFLNSPAHQRMMDHDKDRVIISYCTEDSTFVFGQFLPSVLTRLNPLKVKTKEFVKSRDMSGKNNYLHRDENSDLLVVIFTSNYLEAAFSEVDIKKILQQMNRVDKKIFVFVDFDDDNSVYTFLKDNVSWAVSAFWSSPEFWTDFVTLHDNLVQTKKCDNIIFNKKNLMHNQYYIESPEPEYVSDGEKKESRNSFKYQSFTNSLV